LFSRHAEYGFDPTHARSSGDHDGIYILTRDHVPQNEMMRRIFDRFLDRPDSEARGIAAALHTSVDGLIAVRLVSHHLRLLGVLKRSADADHLVLVDYDDTK